MNYSERSDLRLQLKTTLGWAVHWDCTRFSGCIDIYRRNADELLSFLKKPPQIPIPFLFADTNSRLSKIDSDIETHRLLHNYSAAAMTLVDHSRIFQDKYLSAQSKEVYKNWVKDCFVNNPRAQIIQNLRNYILHADLPTICSNIILITGDVRLMLVPGRLLEWDRWKACVKSYLKDLQKREENILLEELVFECTEQRLSISNWLLNQVVTDNSDSLKDFYQKIQLMNESVKRDGLVADPLVANFFLPQTNGGKN